MNRLFLYSGFLFVLILILDAYDRDYNQPATPLATQEGYNNSASKSQPPSGIVTEAKSSNTESIERDIKSLENSKLVIKYDVISGELLFSRLKKYPVSLGSDEKVIILDHIKKKYTAASNMQVKDQNIIPVFSVAEEDTDRVKLLSNNIPNIIFTKEIQLLDDSHQIEIQNTVINRSNKDLFVRNYEVISRDDNSTASIMLPTYTGSAYYDNENKFSKISFDDIVESDEPKKVKESWISMIEHYFFSAWLPTKGQKNYLY